MGKWGNTTTSFGHERKGDAITIVCAQRDPNGGVWIGSDSRLTLGDSIVPGNHRKWFDCGGWKIGWAGSRRIARLADLSLNGVEDFRKAIIADGWAAAENDNGGPPDYGYNLIATDGKTVCLVHGTGGCVDLGDEFCAIGSGSEYAYGAQWALSSDRRMGIGTLIRAGIEAACQFDCGCGGDLFIDRMEPGNV